MAIEKLGKGAYGATSIAAAGLSVARSTLEVSTANLANAESVGYKRRDVFQTAVPMPEGIASFSSTLDGMTLMKPSVYAVVEDQSAPQREYRPNHPQADAQGYVSLPNINIVNEMTNMMNAHRFYNACATALTEARGIASEARKILTQV
jgi:flagellar basal-body rod protein FlgC